MYQFVHQLSLVCSVAGSNLDGHPSRYYYRAHRCLTSLIETSNMPHGPPSTSPTTINTKGSTVSTIERSVSRVFKLVAGLLMKDKVCISTITPQTHLAISEAQSTLSHPAKVTIRPGLTGTVPVWGGLSRCPERLLSGRQNVPVWTWSPGRDKLF